MENKISYLRRTKGIKQYDLAMKLKVSPSYLCKVEKGLLEPNDEFKEKCAAILNESTDSIFSLPHEKKIFSVISGINSSNNIWSVRLKKNIKQNRLAELLGCSPSYLSKVEKGSQEPNTAFKKKCAKILKIKEIDLFPEQSTTQ